MKHGRWLTRLAWCCLAATVLASAYGLVFRPWQLHWGAVDDEVTRRLPGDELVPDPQDASTRAIRIAASPEAVWPWLVQMGHGKGGLYSYETLENLAGCDLHNADRIVPAWQQLKVGDRLGLGPQGYPFFTVSRIEPARLLLLQAGDATTVGTWAFVLLPDGDGTRLLVRSLRRYPRTVGNVVMWRGLVEPVHFLMEQRMLRGLRDRAERGTQNTLGLPSVAGRTRMAAWALPSGADR